MTYIRVPRKTKPDLETDFCEYNRQLVWWLVLINNEQIWYWLLLFYHFRWLIKKYLAYYLLPINWYSLIVRNNWMTNKENNKLVSYQRGSNYYVVRLHLLLFYIVKIPLYPIFIIRKVLSWLFNFFENRCLFNETAHPNFTN